jgi:hypothetical protein
MQAHIWFIKGEMPFIPLEVLKNTSAKEVMAIKKDWERVQSIYKNKKKKK